MAVEKFSADVGGRTLTIETGKLAQQANGSCTVRYGDTVVLATAVMSKEVREGIDYFPLMVDYEERLYAAGKIKGSRFIKREGRPTDEAILTARIVDRSLRPLFDESIRNDVQVTLTVLSIDQENDPDIVSLWAASCALMISNIPWDGPVTGVRVGRVDGTWIINPTYDERETSDFEIFAVGRGDRTIMIEMEGKQVPEADVADALAQAEKHWGDVTKLIEKVQSKVGAEKTTPDLEEKTEEEQQAEQYLHTTVQEFCRDRFVAILAATDKAEREKATTDLANELAEVLKADNKISKELRHQGLDLMNEMLDTEAKQLIIKQKKRLDGRALDEIRPLSVETTPLPRTHGSAIFARGETQVMSIVTLGSPGDEQTLDTMEESGTKRYMHHYNFPGFSVGEAKPLRGPGRREIGHGALAEKAIVPVLPDRESFPYTIRVVSEVLSSNGSTSMASTCGSSLALMDAGVPISAPVAGISIGIMVDEETEKYQLLTDIQGVEDHVGGMDFKVAGTRTGITAIQLDVKNARLTNTMIREVLDRARTARMQILDVMEKAIAAPRAELSQYAPRILSLRIDPDKIREVIGRGGETINTIIEECGGKEVTKIDIEDDGLVMITSTDMAMAEKALKWIEDMTREISIGDVFEGTITKFVHDAYDKEIGAIVEILPGRDGMVHISEVRNEHIATISDVLKVGEKVKVVVTDIDEERGRMGLSIRRLLPDYDESRDRDAGRRRGGGGFHRGGNDRRGNGGHRDRFSRNRHHR